MRIVLLALLLPLSALAGPWTRNAGQAYVKLSSGLYVADEFFGNDGTVRGGVEYQGLTQALYAEIGIGQGLQLIVYLPHQTATNTFADVGRFRSARLGDAKIGVQYGLPKLPLPVAVRAEAKLPLYDAATPTGPQRSNFPLIGDGQVDLNLWLSAGGSIPGLPAFGFIEIGHQVRTDKGFGEGLGWTFSDGFLGAAQLGFKPLPGVVVAGNLNAVVPYVDRSTTKAYLTVGPAVSWNVWSGLAIEAAYDHTAWARHSAKGTAFILGLSWNQS